MLEKRQKQLAQERDELAKNYTEEGHIEFVKKRAVEYLGKLSKKYRVEIIKNEN